MVAAASLAGGGGLRPGVRLNFRGKPLHRTRLDAEDDQKTDGVGAGGLLDRGDRKFSRDLAAQKTPGVISVSAESSSRYPRINASFTVLLEVLTSAARSRATRLRRHGRASTSPIRLALGFIAPIRGMLMGHLKKLSELCQDINKEIFTRWPILASH